MSKVNPQVAKKTRSRQLKAKGSVTKKVIKKGTPNGFSQSRSVCGDTNARPCIKMYQGEHSKVVDQVEHLLIKMMFSFTNAAASWSGRSPSSFLRRARAKTATIHLEKSTPWPRAMLMSRHIDFLRYDQRADDWKPAVAPLPIAATMIERKAEWKFRNIVGVISTPTVRPNGSLLIEEGYDAETGLLLVNSPEMPPIPHMPTRADAIASLDRLKKLFQEFPYVDDASQAVALSGAISAVARGAFLNAPMHACSATDAGSGKSYQNDVIAIVAIGDKMPVMSTGANEETEKRLASAMIAGQSLISLDNISIPLKGDSLCQLIERPIVKLRILGHSKQVQVDTRSTLVFCAGNQLSLVGDICRRTLLSSLDPKLERPELRRFIANPIAKVQADRGRYVADC